MYYSDTEICKSYRHCFNRVEQVRILAELNGCSVRHIVKVLYDNNMFSSSDVKAIEKRYRLVVGEVYDGLDATSEYKDDVLALVGEGLCNGEIAHELEISVETVKACVRELRFAGLIGKGRQRQKASKFVRHTWSDEEVAKLKRYFAKGLPDKEIALKLGLSAPAIRSKRASLGLFGRNGCWGAREDKVLINALKLGMKQKDIAPKMGFCLSTINKRVRVLRQEGLV